MKGNDEELLIRRGSLLALATFLPTLIACPRLLYGRD